MNCQVLIKMGLQIALNSCDLFPKSLPIIFLSFVYYIYSLHLFEVILYWYHQGFEPLTPDTVIVLPEVNDLRKDVTSASVSPT